MTKIDFKRHFLKTHNVGQYLLILRYSCLGAGICDYQRDQRENRFTMSNYRLIMSQ